MFNLTKSIKNVFYSKKYLTVKGISLTFVGIITVITKIPPIKMKGYVMWTCMYSNPITFTLFFERIFSSNFFPFTFLASIKNQFCNKVFSLSSKPSDFQAFLFFFNFEKQIEKKFVMSSLIKFPKNQLLNIY